MVKQGPGNYSLALVLKFGTTVCVLPAPGGQAAGSGNNMKKARDRKEESKMRVEYNFSRGKRGKYARRYARGANVIVLEPDVVEVFPNAAALNDSLRALAGIMRRQQKTPAVK